MEKGICSKSISAFLLVLLFKELLANAIETTCTYDQMLQCGKNVMASTKYVLVDHYLCDTKTDGGGWIVFQRRVHNDTDFYRTWAEYKKGFGSYCTDYYLGNEFLYSVTKVERRIVELRIDMTYKDKRYFAQYKTFKIDSEVKKYQLTISGFSGNVKDDFGSSHNHRLFTTYDYDNDYNLVGNCAQKYGGGWWYTNCHMVNLNGEFNYSSTGPGINWETLGKGIIWTTVTTFSDSLSSVEMKLRYN